MSRARDRIGAHPLGDGRCSFVVWVPKAAAVDLHLLSPADRMVPLQPSANGYFTAVVPDVHDGALYRYRLDGGEELPDPASRFQPEGVHGPSAVVAHDFPWTDAGWRSPILSDLVIYELHVGTFTHDGTFDGVCRHLPYLRGLGVTAIELMPVAEFPGCRNWGYDGVFPFAAESAYGGPAGLKRLVDACHAHGIGVVLDVVYNHLGPEGNYLPAFGHYFTQRYRTPWGESLNFDEAHSDEVREFFIQNALQWTDEFHIDALRLDAVHGIIDTSARPFLAELSDVVHDNARSRGRTTLLIAESDLADPRVIRSTADGGYGMDGQWLDDLHHAVHSLVTGERDGYYADYGEVAQLARAYCRGFVYAGEYSRYRQRRHGAPAPDARPEQFVVFTQNHDQIGNRMNGDRLAAMLPSDRLVLAAASVLLSPFVPLLFMGEEYGEKAPFPYFVSHTDPELVAAVRRGRAEEFAAFSWAGDPPDPQGEETFAGARLRHALRDEAPHRQILEVYVDLLRLRRDVPVLTRFDAIDAAAHGRMLVVTRRSRAQTAVLALNFGDDPATVPALPAGSWTAMFDSSRDDNCSGSTTVAPGTTLPPWSARLLVSAS
jgi:maltooligosyltrehalose trehalohydrolase